MIQKIKLKSTIYKKLVSIFFIILILLPSVLLFNVKRANAQLNALPCYTIDIDPETGTAGDPIPCANEKTALWHRILTALVAGSTGTSAANSTKELVTEGLKQVIRTAAQRLLAKMTESTVNWINSGFHGSPLFVENPQSFFGDIAKSEIRDLVNVIGYDSVGQPFGRSTALNIINGYKNTFEQNAQYSLSKVTNDPALLERFRNDFSVGGWDGFLLTTQFPQNNYIGYNLLVGDELARRLAGTTENKANTYRDILQQGQGFLSPQICPKEINPNYDNMQSLYNKETKRTGCTIPKPTDTHCQNILNSNVTQRGTIAAQCEVNYENALAAWEKQCSLTPDNGFQNTANTCLKPDGTSGLVNTTPGYVVASQITKALNVPLDKATLTGALGNSITDSIAAIMDALLNKLVSTGLNSLSKGINNIGKSSGNSNNSVTGTGADWTSADNTVVLSTLKSDVQSAITNGNRELAIIDSSASASSTDGILQVYNNLWPKVADLDMCLPGPNYGWEDRVDQGVIADIPTADFKAWVTNKMKIELPSSTTFLNNVNSIKNINAGVADLNARVAAISNALSTLSSIKSELDQITTQPNPGSSADGTLTRLKQRYDGLLIDISTDSTVSDMQNKLADAQSKLSSLSAQISNCAAERTAKGWSNPGGAGSTNSGVTEQTAFCGAYQNPPVSCDTVFKTDPSDYRK